MMKLTSVKLVNTADPLEVALRKIVEGDEVVVTGNTVNRSNTDFVETLEEVFSHVNWLLEVGVAHDCGLIGRLLGEIEGFVDKVDMEG
jgi:2-oxo-4-hydroxy-4-carboxy--5-ureidoimidazoline (OHCU) decarboxylase